jgi:transposase
MMGRQDEPEHLFYAFRLESHVPHDHLLRGIDAVFDFGTIRKSLEPYYSSAGRPSVDPELMIRMLLIGYSFGIRSERRLCEEVHLNLAYRWFCRLGLEGSIPDHSTFSKNRHGRFRESDVFRRVFEDVVRACMAAGLIGGEGFAIDASVIEADASRNYRVEGKLTPPDDEEVTRPVREYLDALDIAAAAESADDGDDTPPGNPASEPRFMSLTDPAAAWTNKGQMKAVFAYGTNYLIDTKEAVIVDVEATPARWSAEVAATKTMLERTRESFGLTPQTLAADAAYGSGLMLGWLMGHGIEPHIPILDHEHQTNGYFTRADFTFDATANAFVCPAGKQLTNSGLVREDGSMPYCASTKDCRECALKARCTKG